MGGDTDTNAAIVGGLIGASVGRTNINPEYIKKILNFNHTLGGYQREEFLIPGNYLPEDSQKKSIEQLLIYAPEKLKITI